MTSTYHLFKASISGLQEAFILHLRDAKCATYSYNQGQQSDTTYSDNQGQQSDTTYSDNQGQ